MNKRKSLLLSVATALCAFAFLITSGSNAKVAAQQMSDMPYDLHYIDMTIMHHEEGIEMAQLAQTKAVNAGVKAFATKTAADQQKDIEELQGYRKQWYADKPMMDRTMMESMMKSMHPKMNMDMDETRRSLRAASGAAFDRMFLDTMTHHHMMAIDMSKDAIAKGEHAEVKEFARKAVAKQQAEIAEMNKLKGGGSPKGTSKARPKPKAKTMPAHKH